VDDDEVGVMVVLVVGSSGGPVDSAVVVVSVGCIGADGPQVRHASRKSGWGERDTIV
jgi:hypothetical protein